MILRDLVYLYQINLFQTVEQQTQWQVYDDMLKLQIVWTGSSLLWEFTCPALPSSHRLTHSMSLFFGSQSPPVRLDYAFSQEDIYFTAAPIFFFFFFLVLVPDVSSQLIAHCPKHSAWIQVPSCVTWGILWDLSVPSRGKVEWIWSWHESDQSPPRLVSSARWDNIHEVCQRACDTGEHTPNVCCSWSVRSAAGSAAGPPRAFDCLVDTYSSGVTAAGLERPRWACKEASLCCSSVSQTVS